MRPPEIESSTREEREKYIAETFQCKGNCEICGFCAAFHGKTAEVVYADYVKGTESFAEASMKHR